MKELLRDSINKENIIKINIEIQAIERMINFYIDYEEKNGEHEYTTERLHLLNVKYAEFLIARELSENGEVKSRVIGN
jgi:hypothetical protein